MAETFALEQSLHDEYKAWKSWPIPNAITYQLADFLKDNVNYSFCIADTRRRIPEPQEFQT